mgnify:CR=1 FL=1
MNIDYQILDWLNSHHLPGSTIPMQFLSAWATVINIVAVATILVIALTQRSKVLLHRFFLLAVVMILAALAISLLKEVAGRERPFLTYPSIEKMSKGGGSSFPSGHTMESFAVAAAFAFLFRNRWLVILFFLWAALVGYTRIALGVHYPSDVAGGAILGAAFGWFIPMVGQRFFLKREKVRDG